MPLINRTLAPAPVTSLQEYLDGGGGRGLVAARDWGPEAVITRIEQSGLRARGGAGAPCGLKWRRVRAYGSGAAVPSSVIVNAAEGEPGSFKDRALLSRNPYKVIEGALIAAVAVGAGDVVIAMKRMHTELRRRTNAAIDEIRAQGWLDGVDVQVFEGPNEYLYGEESAMLEAIDGRAPFPRIAPPYRHGIHEIGSRASAIGSVGESTVYVELAGPDPESFGPPTLVNNVETLANVPAIIADGPEWFRSIGTSESPGSLVCTVTGATRHHGVGEVPMGTPLREVIDLIGGGPGDGRSVKAVIGGAATVSGAVLGTFAVTAAFEGLRTLENEINIAEVFPKPLVGLTEVVLACAMIGFLILRPGGLIGNYELAALPRFRGLFRAANDGRDRPGERAKH